MPGATTNRTREESICPVPEPIAQSLDDPFALAVASSFADNGKGALNTPEYNSTTGSYGSSCASNSKAAQNTPETRRCGRIRFSTTRAFAVVR
eukprot:521453-Pyramimonas_sp.AAC.1